jgi:hypothetical protein
VADPRRVSVAPRAYEHRFEVVSGQRVLHVRQRDELVWADHPGLRVEVTGIRLTGAGARVSVRVRAGQRKVGLPAAGTALELVPAVPDWGRLGRERGRLKVRLATTPWTHQEGPMPAPAPPPLPPPADPLAAVEALR